MSDMKVYAMYLPQFHRIPENDLWWGDGFTDWVSARTAKPLFDGHYQPHIPQGEKYYDLLSKETMKWQASLMEKYGIDGICMYHYWFKDGRKILEKPAENLLTWQDISIPFCFCWATDPWATSWTKIRYANVWAERLEKDNNGQEILLEQEYGDSLQWKKHFDYCLDFFKDDRYLRIDDKPIFMFFRPNEISCLGEMIDFWKKEAVKAGLKGIYFIGSLCSVNTAEYMDAVLYHEPTRSFSFLTGNNFGESCTRLDYDGVWNNIIGAKGMNSKTFYGAFVGYDDTPRRGKKGRVVEGSTPEKFCYYLEQIMAKNESEGHDIVFINAWNEWGEGMHLEPDQKYGEGFLNAVLRAKKQYKRYVDKYNNVGKQNDEYTILLRNKEKFESYLNLLDYWMTLREDNHSIGEKLEKMGHNRVLIYGYGIIGRHLEHELKDSDIEVVGVIDRQKNKIRAKSPVFSPDEELPEHNLVIIASYAFRDEILKMDFLQGENVISADELIYGIDGK